MAHISPLSSDIGVIHLDDREIPVGEGLDGLGKLPPHLVVGEAEVIGHHHVKDQVGVDGAGGDAEIVDGELGIQGGGQFSHLLPQPGGALVPQSLELAKKCGTLEETVFVLDWPYEKARAVFGDDLEKVVYCPVVEDKIANLDTYVDEWLANFKPFAFQFRFASNDTRTFALLPKILESGSRAFVAATWYNHTAGHDDRASLMGSPEDGWGWLVERGFTILETNFPREMKSWLKQGEAK